MGKLWGNRDMRYLILLVAGICQGSFGLGYKKFNPLSWEAFWGVYSLLCLIVMSAWTFFVQPDILSIISQVGLNGFVIPFLCGMLWGLSTVAFSKSVIMVGIALCFGVNMGTSAVVGSLIPFFTSNIIPSTSSVVCLIIGTILTVIGIVIITKAGIMKEKTNKSSSAKIGIILAFISGLCSGIMNIGFVNASSLGLLASNDIAASAVQWFPVLAGGNISAILFCMVLLFKNKTWNTFNNKKVPKRIAVLGITSIVWFAALALYGISTKLIGEAGSSVGWLIFNAIALIVSNFWGIRSGEWKGCKKELKTLYLGDAILLVSWGFIVFV